MAMWLSTVLLALLLFDVYIVGDTMMFFKQSLLSYTFVSWVAGYCLKKTAGIILQGMLHEATAVLKELLNYTSNSCMTLFYLRDQAGKGNLIVGWACKQGIQSFYVASVDYCKKIVALPCWASHGTLGSSSSASGVV